MSGCPPLKGQQFFVAGYCLFSVSEGEFAAVAGGRQCGWRYTPSLQSSPEGFPALIYSFVFPFNAQKCFSWRPEFIIQVEQKKAGLKMEMEPNECCLV